VVLVWAFTVASTVAGPTAPAGTLNVQVVELVQVTFVAAAPPTVKLVPPLVINEQDVAYFLQAFEDVMRGMHRIAGPAPELLARIGRNSLSRRSYDAAAAATAGDTA
jgi:hypothetical protein